MRTLSAPKNWWLTLYPRLSARAKRQVAALCLAGAMVTQPIAGYVHAAPAARPETGDAYSRPAVQRALHDLGLSAPSVPHAPMAPDTNWQVNTFTLSNQRYPAVALDSDGDFVVVWQSNGSSFSDGFQESIQAQRYNSVGTAQGAQFQVNTYTTGNQVFPDVALDSAGDFVVVWQSYGSYGTDTMYHSVQAQRYNSVGTAQGAEFQVNTSITTQNEMFPSVALDSDGDFVVAWQSVDPSSGIGDIEAQRYNSVGTLQGSEFTVNTYTTSRQNNPDVALDSDGDFVVVWHSDGSSGTDNYSYSTQGQRYNSAGTAQGAQFQINTNVNGPQAYASVAMDSAGDFVVVWECYTTAYGDPSGYSVQGQRFDNTGTPVGVQFQVNVYTTFAQQHPSVAMDSDGDFAVSWESYGADGDTSFASIQARSFSKSGLPLVGEFQVNRYTTDYQLNAAVGVDSNGDFVIAWASDGSFGTDSSLRSIQAGRFDLGQLDWQVNTYTTQVQINASVATDSAGDFVIVWQSYGGSGTDTLSYSVQGQRFDSHGIPLGAQFQVNSYTTYAQLLPSVAMDSDGDFVVVWAGGDGYSGVYDIYGQRYNSFGVAQGTEFQVNSYTTNVQRSPAVAMDSDGDFVVTWQSGGSPGDDYLGYSIVARGFNNFGTAQGPDFQVNTFTNNNQRQPAVASDSAGDFVVTWMSYGSNGTDAYYYSIQAQRYNSVGTAQGAEFQVNTFTTGFQTSPSVALDSDGDFVVAWDSFGSFGDDTFYTSVQARRYNSAGVAQGAEFQVNTYTPGPQYLPAVAMDSAGDFVVTWTSYGSFGSDAYSPSVQARRYTSAGTAQGVEFQVNVYTTNVQIFPAIALDSDGDFVIAWQSLSLTPTLIGKPGDAPQDDNDYAIAASRFGPLGGPEPTVLSLHEAGIGESAPESAWPAAVGALSALGALAAAWWARARKR